MIGYCENCNEKFGEKLRSFQSYEKDNDLKRKAVKLFVDHMTKKFMLDKLKKKDKKEGK